jgi:hypothetical protein
MKFLISALALGCAMTAAPAMAQDADASAAATTETPAAVPAMVSAIKKINATTSPAGDQRAAKMKLLAYLDEHKIQRDRIDHKPHKTECVECAKADCADKDCDHAKPKPKCEKGQKC